MRPGPAVCPVVLLVVALALPAGCGGATGAAGDTAATVTAGATVTTAPPTSQATTPLTALDEAALSAEDRAMLAEIRALHADWKSGKIEIDWPPPGVDAANAPYPTDLEELFQWLEQGVFAPEVTVFLKDEVDAAEELQAEIAGWPEVIGVRFVSKDEALARLRADLADHADILDDLAANPLPASIEITVNDYAIAAVVGERLQGRPEVDEVRWAGSHYPYRSLVVWLRSQAHVAGGGATGTPTASGVNLTLAEQEVFDRLDSAEVVQAYFSSGDPAVEYYLSGPWLRDVTTQPNSMPDREREGGVDDLVVEGPFSGPPSQVYDQREWPEQVHFRVTYTSRKTSSIGEPPGKRLWFVTAGRQAPDSPWKVLEIGSGP